MQALQGFHMGHLSCLQSLHLVDIGSMTALSQWVGDLISLQDLHILDCWNLNDLPESIGGLTSLHKLAITRCNSITSLPKSIQQLTKLKTLIISGCDELAKWCETEENKTLLAHTKVIKVPGVSVKVLWYRIYIVLHTLQDLSHACLIFFIYTALPLFFFFTLFLNNGIVHIPAST